MSTAHAWTRLSAARSKYTATLDAGESLISAIICAHDDIILCIIQSIGLYAGAIIFTSPCAYILYQHFEPSPVRLLGPCMFVGLYCV